MQHKSALRQIYLNQKIPVIEQQKTKDSWRNHYKLFLTCMLIGTLVGCIALSPVLALYIKDLKSKSESTNNTENISTVQKICFTIPSPRPSNKWFFVGNMSTARGYHTSTLISQDNSVLIAGGRSNSMLLASMEKYIPSTGCLQMFTSTTRGRYGHTANQLSSLWGLVLFAGGFGINGALNVIDLVDPITGITLTISMTAPRYWHTATVLNSSKLVFIGGMDTTNTVLNTGDLLTINSQSSIMSVNNTMTASRMGHTATRLGDNSDVVLIVGGRDNSIYHSSAILYHGSSNTFISLGSGVNMLTSRAYHTATYLSSPIHKVLLTGGIGGWVSPNTMTLFDIATLSFTTPTSTMSSKRAYHTATLLPNGKIFIIGGHDGIAALNTCELIDPNNNGFSSTSADNLTVARYQHTATLIANEGNGAVLVCGGSKNSTSYLNSCEIYYV